MKDIFDTEYRDLVISGKVIRATVKIVVEQDEYPEGDFDFGSKEANDEYLARFNNGELECVSILVTATVLGEQGFDSLGMCHVSTSDFAKDINEYLESHNMVSHAVSDLKENIIKKAQALKFAMNGGAK